MAGDRYFCGNAQGVGDWNVDGNWKLNSNCTGDTVAPTAGDRAIVPSNKTCTVEITTAVADRIEVYGTLNVATGKKLTLDGDDGESIVEGTVNLHGSASEIAITGTSHTLEEGATRGTIVGGHEDARISIALNLILTSELLIEGQLQIMGNGKFLSNGQVHANTAGAIQITTKLVDDGPTALWKVSNSSSAVLRFEITDTIIPVMDGDFEVIGGGTLVLNNQD